MNLLVDGVDTDPERFVVPPMRLSSSTSAMRAHRFRLAVPIPTLVDMMTADYRCFIAEDREDDRLQGGPQDALGRAGYPELSALVASPHLLAEVFTGYLGAKFVSTVTWTRRGQIDFWFDHIDSCATEGDMVVFRGGCYSRKGGGATPVAGSSSRRTGAKASPRP